MKREMNMIFRIAIMALALHLAGCASFSEKTTRTLLMNRATGEMKECNVDKWRSKESYEKYKECIRDYEEQGYTVWSQY